MQNTLKWGDKQEQVIVTDECNSYCGLNSQSGSGSSGSSIYRYFINVVPGDIMTVTIGAGARGGYNINTDKGKGSTGGVTRIKLRSIELVCNGGIGGNSLYRSDDVVVPAEFSRAAEIVNGITKTINISKGGLEKSISIKFTVIL